MHGRSPHSLAVPRYEQHLRAILGWPLGDSSLTVGAAIMLNVLGEADGEDGMRRAHELMGRAYKVCGTRSGCCLGNEQRARWVVTAETVKQVASRTGHVGTVGSQQGSRQGQN